MNFETLHFFGKAINILLFLAAIAALYAVMFVGPSVCRSVRQSVCLYVCLSVGPSVHLLVGQSVSWSVCRSVNNEFQSFKIFTF